MEEVRIVESTPFKGKKPVIINGLPEVGLVGPIAAKHLVESLKFSEIGFLESDLFPPVTVLHDRKLVDPVRIYSNSSLILLLSEIPIPPDAIYPMTRALVSWYETKDPELVIFMGGVPTPNREEKEEPKVVGIASNKQSEAFLTKNGIEVLEEGFIVGLHGLILKECSRRGIPAIYLTAEAHYGIPDPGAAAKIIKTLNKGFDLKIDVKKLLEKEEEIRVKSRDLMKRTEESMRRMQKGQEQELPIMYG
jgi:uncharacterized protein